MKEIPAFSRRFASALVVLLVLALLPLVLHQREDVMNILIVALVWAVVAEAWNLILGYASVFSFAQVAFLAIGGYTSGMLCKYAGLSPWLGLIAGGLVAAVVGVLVGLPCLRLKGIYVGIVTFAIQLVLPAIIIWGGQGYRRYSTGGSFGLPNIPPFSVFGHAFNMHELVPWYYLALCLFSVFFLVIWRIIHSAVGMAFIALRDSQPFAEALGVDAYKYKLIVFGVSSFITGTIGAFYAHYQRIIDPAVLNTDIFLMALVMVVLGGIGRFPGGAVGAFVITILNELLRATQKYRLVILGVVVVLALTYMPKGLIGLLDRIVARKSAHDRRQEPEQVTPV